MTPCFFGTQDKAGTYEISIELTNRCNLHCMHCMNSSTSKTEQVGLSLEEIDILVDEFIENNVVEVYISGGEPTLHPYFKHFVEKLNSKKIVVLLATNAYDIAPYLDTIQKNIKCVFVSIDGTPEIHDHFRGVKGAYEKTLSNVRLLLSHKIPVRISTVVSKSNLDSLENIIQAVKGLGVCEIHFTVLVNIGRAQDNKNVAIDEKDYRYIVERIKELTEAHEKTGFRITMRRNDKLTPHTDRCYGGERMAHMSTTGLIAPCSYIAKSPLSEKYSAQWSPGNLHGCFAFIRKFQQLCVIRDEYFGHPSCAAMASITSGTTSELAVDPLDVIFVDDV